MGTTGHGLPPISARWWQRWPSRVLPRASHSPRVATCGDGLCMERGRGGRLVCGMRDGSPGHHRPLTAPRSHREVPEPRLERHAPHRSASLSVKAAVLEKISQARRVQRAKQLAEKPWLSQKALQRQDRARQRPPRRARQRTGSFLHQPCQRHCY